MRPALIVVAVALAGCVAGPSLGGATMTVRILVTEDFADDVVLDERARVAENASAMAALVAVADVETRHGGNFVVAIDGHESRYPQTRLDWFFMVDGLSQPVGPRQRTLGPGDVVHFDLHRWDHVTDPGGSLAAWPAPFADASPAVVGPAAVADDVDGPRRAEPGAGPVVVAGRWNASVFAPVNEAPHAAGSLVHPAEGFAVHDGAGETVPVEGAVRARIALVPSPWGAGTDPALIVQGRTRADAVDAWHAFQAADGRAHAWLWTDRGLREVPR